MVTEILESFSSLFLPYISLSTLPNFTFHFLDTYWILKFSPDIRKRKSNFSWLPSWNSV